MSDRSQAENESAASVAGWAKSLTQPTGFIHADLAHHPAFRFFAAIGGQNRAGYVLVATPQMRFCPPYKATSRTMSRRSEVSAGILAYRLRDRLEVLLAHPGGPLWAKKDIGAWSIPKGLVETGDLLACARREFTEETNLTAEGEFIPLAPVKQKSGKVVHAFALAADFDLAQCSSNYFKSEWPPRSGKWKSFPEIDRVAYFDVDTALEKILVYQQPFIHELARRLGVT
jgi:predicted NUDIX family NTP pyrophosphohydrolase